MDVPSHAVEAQAPANLRMEPTAILERKKERKSLSGLF